MLRQSHAFFEAEIAFIARFRVRGKWTRHHSPPRPSIHLYLFTFGGVATGVVVGVVDSSSCRWSKSDLLNVRADLAAQA